jgi:hypothetical protein
VALSVRVGVLTHSEQAALAHSHPDSTFWAACRVKERQFPYTAGLTILALIENTRVAPAP